jgi:hypothetical protein
MFGIDKVTIYRTLYTFGVYQGLLTAFFLGLNITYAKQFHLFKFLVLMPYRFVDFRSKKEHYYMCEFCYYANFLMCSYLAYTLFVDSSYTGMFPFSYSISSGPILLAIYMNRDRMYFHSPRHLVSVFIHLSPALLFWKMRWMDDHLDYVSLYPPVFTIRGIWDTYKMFVTDLVPYYIIWALIYYMTMFVFRKDRIKEKGYKNMFIFIKQNPKHAAYQFIPHSKSELIQGMIFMGLHMVSTLITIIVSSVMFNSYYFNTVMLFIIATISIWNAAYKYAKLLDDYELSKNKKKE